MTSRHLQAAILAAGLCVAASAAGAAVIRLGDIRLAYDPARWELADETDASTFADIPPAGIRLSCKLPACRNRSGQAAVWLRVTAGETASCRGIAEAEEWPISTLLRPPPGGQDFGGLVMHVWTTHSACPGADAGPSRGLRRSWRIGLYPWHRRSFRLQRH